MNKDNPYFAQVQWLLRILPSVMEEECFALKGGTAINLFWQNLPRFSVDIDLTYIGREDRATSLKKISAALERTKDRIEKLGQSIKVRLAGSKHEKLLVHTPGGQIIIEVNTTLRGSIHPIVEKELCSRGQELFEMEVVANSLSEEELYGGKICAALDRQHPRDLFDIKLMFDGEGLTDGIRKAFIVYLVSHNRPIHEVLNPHLKNIKKDFKSSFEGMTDQDIKVNELEKVRKKLIKEVTAKLTDKEKKFILSVKEGTPQWKLMGMEHLDSLPGIQWKLANIKRMAPEKSKKQVQKLKKVLAM